MKWSYRISKHRERQSFIALTDPPPPFLSYYPAMCLQSSLSYTPSWGILWCQWISLSEINHLVKTSEWPNIYAYYINLSLTYFCNAPASHIQYIIKLTHLKNSDVSVLHVNRKGHHHSLYLPQSLSRNINPRKPLCLNLRVELIPRSLTKKLKYSAYSKEKHDVWRLESFLVPPGIYC